MVIISFYFTELNDNLTAQTKDIGTNFGPNSLFF
jgi:hypothetical protein